MMLSLVFLIVIALLMAARDFRFRAIEAFYYLLLAGAVVFYAVMRASPATLFFNLCCNLLLLLSLMAGLWGYFKARSGTSLKDLFVTKLGMGDLLFWIATAPLFSPFNFIFWMTGSLLAILMIYGVVYFAGSRKQQPATVPLAGMQALLLVLLLTLNQFTFMYNIFEEPLILSALYNP